MTNLRLPGQYDERLLSAVGLQGPYYNWNRWYLPSVGRYLELDPIGDHQSPAREGFVNQRLRSPAKGAEPVGAGVAGAP